jgi:uncharacterized protein
MLIDFSVTNFKSIKEKQTFSMIPAAKVKELPQNVIQKGSQSLLSSAIIYGKNASGKSNLLKALNILFSMVRLSDVKQETYYWIYTPFLLADEREPIIFDLNFIGHKGLKYNYFLTYDNIGIINETLSVYHSRKASLIFNRERGKASEIGEGIKSLVFKAVENATYDYQTILSKAEDFKIEALSEPYNTLKNYTAAIIQDDFNAMTANLSWKFGNKQNDKSKKWVEQLLRIADTDVTGFSFKLKDKENQTLWDSYDIVMEHKTQLGRDVFFPIEAESMGTQKLLYAGSYIAFTLEQGGIIIIDELDKSLHPHLTKVLINLFQNPKTNPKGAQLIFASHDATLLSSDLFRRDQIWFAEKERDGSSYYYALADLKDVRAGIPYEKYYLKGAFGATPMIDELELDFTYDTPSV